MQLTELNQSKNQNLQKPQLRAKLRAKTKINKTNLQGMEREFICYLLFVDELRNSGMPKEDILSLGYPEWLGFIHQPKLQPKLSYQPYKEESAETYAHRYRDAKDIVTQEPELASVGNITSIFLFDAQYQSSAIAKHMLTNRGLYHLQELDDLCAEYEIDTSEDLVFLNAQLAARLIDNENDTQRFMNTHKFLKRLSESELSEVITKAIMEIRPDLAHLIPKIINNLNNNLFIPKKLEEALFEAIYDQEKPYIDKPKPFIPAPTNRKRRRKFRR